MLTQSTTLTAGACTGNGRRRHYQWPHPRRLPQARLLKQAAHLTFCFYLQHRHHTVGAEAVVKVEGTARLMDGQVVKDIISFGNKVVPTTWMASSGKVLPMEFAVVPAAYVVFLSAFPSHHM